VPPDAEGLIITNINCHMVRPPAGLRPDWPDQGSGHALWP